MVSVPWRGLRSFGPQRTFTIIGQGTVSVPWRGLRSFGPVGGPLGILMALISFRPLAGITVFRTSPTASATAPRETFPSPGGDYGLSDAARQKYLQYVRMVSVPWRGLRSFGLGHLGIDREPDLWVSVPWRGLRSFGPDDWRCKRPSWREFPSPGGDYGLSDAAIGEAMVLEFGFPSPGGDYGLSDLDKVTVSAAWLQWFPSPGGDYGLSDSRAKALAQSGNG